MEDAALDELERRAGELAKAKAQANSHFVPSWSQQVAGEGIDGSLFSDGDVNLGLTAQFSSGDQLARADAAAAKGPGIPGFCTCSRSS